MSDVWKKSALVVSKMSKPAQDSYFSKFPDRVEWFKKQHPDMGYFRSARIAAKTAPEGATADNTLKQAVMSKAYGATPPMASTPVSNPMGGDFGGGESSIVEPKRLSLDQYRKVIAAKREALAAKKSPHVALISKMVNDRSNEPVDDDEEESEDNSDYRYNPDKGNTEYDNDYDDNDDDLSDIIGHRRQYNEEDENGGYSFTRAKAIRDEYEQLSRMPMDKLQDVIVGATGVKIRGDKKTAIASYLNDKHGPNLVRAALS